MVGNASRVSSRFRMSYPWISKAAGRYSLCSMPVASPKRQRAQLVCRPSLAHRTCLRAGIIQEKRSTFLFPSNPFSMSFAESCDWTLCRSVLLVLTAWPLCIRLERVLRTASPSVLFWGMFTAPFLLPELLLGYLLAPWVVGVPWKSELACACVLFVRSVPVGVIALWGTPPSPVSPAAIHVRRLKLQTFRDSWQLAADYVYGPIRRAMPALGLMFFVTFQEFEAAALFGSVSWTDALFTEHATGLSLTASLSFLIRPLIMQVVVLSLIVWSLAGLSWRISPEFVSEEESQTASWDGRFARFYVYGIFVLSVVVPLGWLSSQLIGGWHWLWTQPQAWQRLGREIATASLVGVVAGLATWNLAQSLLSKRFPGWISLVCSLPGLCGGLSVSLALMWVASRPFLHCLSFTPLFWVLALIVWLLPRAILLQLWFAQRTEPASLHLVELLRDSPDSRQRHIARRWWWQWRVEPQIAACGLLCYWAYLDLTTAAILRPTGMESIMVRLYNFMHFGYSAAMSMEATLAMLVPLAIGGVLFFCTRTGLGRRSA